MCKDEVYAWSDRELVSEFVMVILGFSSLETLNGQFKSSNTKMQIALVCCCFSGIWYLKVFYFVINSKGNLDLVSPKISFIVHCCSNMKHDLGP